MGVHVLIRSLASELHISMSVYISIQLLMLLSLLLGMPMTIPDETRQGDHDNNHGLIPRHDKSSAEWLQVNFIQTHLLHTTEKFDVRP